MGYMWLAARPRRLLLLLFCLQIPRTTLAQELATAPLENRQVTKLAEFMCAQLPNVRSIVEYVRIETPSAAPTNPPAQNPFTVDDVHDALVRLGSYSLPCLTDHLLDTRWMPDPRSEPLLGAPLVGDVAYMILMDKGAQDLMPRLTHNDNLRMDDYFSWPATGNNRRRLQDAVRAWLGEHPNCCGGPPQIWNTAQSEPSFRMSPTELSKARAQFNRLHPGMKPAEVLAIKGKPDGIDVGNAPSDSSRNNLLGFCANDHNEHLAYIYFTERWTPDIARRDPLRDRYVIVFFSGEGKMTRMLSNVAEIPSIFPHSYPVWIKLMWGPKALAQ
jgi:hypothetical protein